MRKLLNNLYITQPHYYLGRDGSNIIVKDEDGKKIFQSPIQNFESIICFNYTGMSPSLMQLCVEKQVGIHFLTPWGKLQAKVFGPVRGNVLLRKAQYRISEDDQESLEFAKAFVLGKVYNSIKVLDRGLRDYPDHEDVEALRKSIQKLKEDKARIYLVKDDQELFGLEGDTSREYFKNFNFLIRKNQDFTFNNRNRRPPLDPVNAMLSLAYGLLRIMFENALETVGLDPYVGFFHKDRPGRTSLALDMMEELRAYMADRLVVSVINRGQVKSSDFYMQASGAVLFKEEGFKKFLDLWNKRLQDKIKHPFLEEQIEIGLLPYSQALLMARTIRGDLEAYPPFSIS